MRPWQLAFVTLVVGIAALGSGWHPLYLIFYVLALALAGSYLIAVWSTVGLAFARTLPGGRMQVGETLEERLRLENRSIMPKLWVQVTDGSTLPGHHAGYVANLGGHKRIDWRVRTLCSRRGRFYVGPVTATTGDPLGLFTRTVPLASQRELLVLPAVLPIGRFNLFPGIMPGRGRGAQRSLQTTTNAVTVRDYVPGDAMSRIHWPSTARLQRFMIKEYDLDPTIDVWIALDLDATVQAGEGRNSTEEYGVTIAATLANYFLRTDLSVGLVLNDESGMVLGLDRGSRQLDRTLEVLAVAHSSDAPSLSMTLTLNEVRFMRNSALVVITPSRAPSWAQALQQLQRRGVRTAAILLDAKSFDQMTAQPASNGLENTLAVAGIANLTVRRGENLARLLENAGEPTTAVR
jgi:uncharacterized protein (DUF58 family)